jgi:hypothetical protein
MPLRVKIELKTIPRRSGLIQHAGFI